MSKNMDINREFVILISSCTVDEVQEYINKGANVNFQYNGQSPLSEACAYGIFGLEKVNLLLKNGADVNPNQDFLPLHGAIEAGNLEIVQLLLSKGAQTDTKSGDGKNALELAQDMAKNAKKEKKGDYDQIVNLILNRQFTEAVHKGDIEEAKRLLGLGANIDTLDKFGETSLYHAAKYNSLEMLKFLVENGAQVNPKTIHKPLHAAVQSPEKTQFLLDNGANIDAIGSAHKDTALHTACNYGKIEVVKILLERGAKTDIRDNSNKTALDIAKDRKKDDINGPYAQIEILIEQHNFQAAIENEVGKQNIQKAAAQVIQGDPNNPQLPKAQKLKGFNRRNSLNEVDQQIPPKQQSKQQPKGFKAGHTVVGEHQNQPKNAFPPNQQPPQQYPNQWIPNPQHRQQPHQPVVHNQPPRQIQNGQDPNQQQQRHQQPQPQARQHQKIHIKRKNPDTPMSNNKKAVLAGAGAGVGAGIILGLGVWLAKEKSSVLDNETLLIGTILLATILTIAAGVGTGVGTKIKLDSKVKNPHAVQVNPNQQQI